MNVMYRIVQNTAAGQWTVASEWTNNKKATLLMGLVATAALGFIATGSVAFAQANANGAPQAHNTTEITHLNNRVPANETDTTPLPSQTGNNTAGQVQQDTTRARTLTAWPIALLSAAPSMQ
ncbi:hypothetical protein ACFFJT_04010 [Dyella flava]|uniref:Extended Signal Peptide of Type V secretion system n=1 Tax=Dyella flava TaxID=1920170 RepID=A0ABS2K5S4_9GAMM|nr:hypothetical protein [Dyella flava]MBM7126519.1 hypothetical protein [Dyella flava]GLQ49662.1 hypothetical protein GCM10010872_11110 [Dyella flava]